MPAVHAFVLLQFLDFMTTLIGLQWGGARELNPLIQRVMQLGPATGLLICKLAAMIGGGFLIWFKRERVLLILNYIFAFIVAWNVCNLFLIRPH